MLFDRGGADRNVVSKLAAPHGGMQRRTSGSGGGSWACRRSRPPRRPPGRRRRRPRRSAGPRPPSCGCPPSLPAVPPAACCRPPRPAASPPALASLRLPLPRLCCCCCCTQCNSAIICTTASLALLESVTACHNFHGMLNKRLFRDFTSRTYAWCRSVSAGDAQYGVSQHSVAPGNLLEPHIKSLKKL